MSFDNLFCNNLQTNTINGSPPGGGSVKCLYRIGVDASSNPGPTGGLIVKYNITQPSPLYYNMPLTINPIGLGMADNFKDDINNNITVNSNTITINTDGKYLVTISLAVGSTYSGSNILVAQLLKNTQEVFTYPPGVNCATNFFDTSALPIPFSTASFLSGSNIITCYTGDEIALVLWLLADQVEIQLTSSISIEKL